MKKESTTAYAALGLLCLISAVNPAVSADSFAQTRMVTQSANGPAVLSYADVVDLADSAPLIATVRIRNIIAVPPEQVGTVTAGTKRLLIEADVVNLIRGEGGISPQVRYLYDTPLDRKGKVPKLKKAQVILFARPGARPGEIQLVAPDAQVAATPALTDEIRRITGELLSNQAAPRITGLGDAFHVAGTIAGEGETQIFLRTEKGDPVSLSILRRPGQEPRWAVALGEIVDEAARAPEPGTLLWYRLACFLPPALPSRSVRTLPVQDAEAARADYQFVIQALGSCGRTRKPPA